ncbi:MAG: A/G-specific adenine glycosylase [Butyricicoccus sp.]
MTEQQRLHTAAAHLLGWYDASRRILPWRELPTPYRVWVSEIMLQQTRVEAVKPYYERFLTALPTVQALADAPEEQLMKLWEGLGYYSRVRNLQKAARVVCEQYGGELPRTSAELVQLPGIGPYTAGAIASIACGEVCTAVDGNVLRVISRILARDWDIKSNAVKQEVTRLVRDMIPADRPGDFNQSLMELGAMVCLPNGAPDCGNCPWHDICLTREQGRQDEIPKKSAKKARPVEQRVVYLLLGDGKVALRRRPKKGLLAGLWEFPNVLEGEQPDFGVTLRSQTDGKRAKHIFSHVEWQMRGVTAQAEPNGEELYWATAQELREEIALPSAFRVYRAEALNLLQA